MTLILCGSECCVLHPCPCASACSCVHVDVGVHLQNDGPGEAFFPSSPCFCLGPDTDEPNRVLVNIYPPVRAGNPLARQKKPRGRQGFRNAFSESVLPRLRAFKPDIVFVSAGFDGAYSDPIGGQLGLRPTDFHWMTRMLQEVADEMSNGRLVSVLGN